MAFSHADVPCRGVIEVGRGRALEHVRRAARRVGARQAGVERLVAAHACTRHDGRLAQRDDGCLLQQRQRLVQVATGRAAQHSHSTAERGSDAARHSTAAEPSEKIHLYQPAPLRWGVRAFQVLACIMLQEHMLHAADGTVHT